MSLGRLYKGTVPFGRQEVFTGSRYTGAAIYGLSNDLERIVHLDGFILTHLHTILRVEHELHTLAHGGKKFPDTWWKVCIEGSVCMRLCMKLDQARIDLIRRA
jgi:hypothetical protein